MSPMIEDSIDRSQSNSSDRLEVCEPRVSGRVKPMATSEVTDAEDGTAIDADVGDTILLAVLDNPTTGYRWELEPVTGVSIVLDEAGYETSSGEAGSGGVATDPERRRRRNDRDRPKAMAAMGRRRLHPQPLHRDSRRAVGLTALVPRHNRTTGVGVTLSIMEPSPS